MNMHTRLTIMATGLALMQLASGCASPPPSTSRGPNEFKNDSLAIEDYPQIVSLNRVNKMAVLHGEPVTSVSETGVYSVRIPFRSIRNRATTFKYRYIYFGADGAEIDRDTWVTVSVPPGTMFQVSGESIYSGISEWRLEIDRHYGIGERP